MKILVLELKHYIRLALNHISYIKLTPENKIQLILGSNGSGKAQPLDSLIKVPNGWDIMGNMKVGSKVIAKDGTITTVNGVFPQGVKNIYTITFADGRTARATADHLWKIYVGGKKYPITPRVVTTLEIIQLLETKTYNNLLWIDLIDSEQNDVIDLPIDPYLLGVVLGDGCIDSSIVISHPDEFIMNKLSNKLKNDMSITIRNTGDKKCLKYSLVSKNPGFGSNHIMNYLRECGLLYKRSHDKFIPDVFLLASTNQRLELLQGLMDTDGTIDRQGTSSYSTTSLELAEGVQRLVRSLGGIASISKRYPVFTHMGEKKNGKLAYQVNIRYKKPSELFTLPKKKERTNDDGQYCKTLKLRIDSVELTSIEQAQCISIDHPDKLYITNDFVVTHNSSLIKELSPLPGLPAEFKKDGYKYIEILHNQSHYCLRSVFASTGNRFSFIKDDVELNPGGTVTVYRDLVKREFNITPEIHDLLCGFHSFHRMSIAERRSWFTKISDCDYNYAITYYNKLKEQFRDIQGGIKLNQSRLVQESEKLLSPAEEDQLREEIKHLRTVLQLLLDCKTPLAESRFELNQGLEDNENTLDRLSREMIAYRKRFLNWEGFQSVSDIDHAIITHQARVNSLSLKVDELCHKIEADQNKYTALEKTNLDSLNDLDTHLDFLLTAIHDEKQKIQIAIQFDQPKDALQALITVKANLIDIFTHIPPDENKRMTRENYESLLRLKTEKTTGLKTSEDALSEFIRQQKDLEHARDHNQVECPKCQYTWLQGYDEAIYRTVLKSIELEGIKIERFKTSLAELDVQLEEMREYNLLVKQYKAVVSNWEILNPLWQYLTSLKTIAQNPKTVLTVLQDIEMDLSSHVRLYELSKQLEDTLAIKDLTEKDQAMDFHSLKTSIESNNRELYQANKSIQYSKAYVERLNEYRDISLKMEILSEEIARVLKDTENQRDRLIDIYRQEALGDVIQLVRLDVARKEQLLSRIDIQKALVDDIGQQITTLTDKSDVLKIAVQELSPTEGLIAKGLAGFINHFVSQMNSFIKKIWLYPLELIPISPDKENELELDYKFAVKVNDQTIIPDITRGSSAMREVIDLAFRVISMQYLDLQEAPLFLDELGSSFDKAHRDNIKHLMHNLTISSSFSQIFIISHYEEMYGSFKNSDIAVLCPSNISEIENSVVNTHVIIN